jgi:hypothetical protein
MQEQEIVTLVDDQEARAVVINRRSHKDTFREGRGAQSESILPMRL